jgi:hypothetical protein
MRSPQSPALLINARCDADRGGTFGDQAGVEKVKFGKQKAEMGRVNGRNGKNGKHGTDGAFGEGGMGMELGAKEIGQRRDSQSSIANRQ